jgi:hypothetical protein
LKYPDVAGKIAAFIDGGYRQNIKTFAQQVWSEVPAASMCQWV